MPLPFKRKAKKSMSKKKKRLLVTRFSALGDVAMLAPVLQEFIEQNPNVEVYVASRPKMKAIFDQVEGTHFLSIDLDHQYKGLWGILRLYRYLKTFHFTEYADCHQVLRTQVLGMLFRISGVEVSALNKGRKEKKALISQKNKILQPLRPMTERYADVFRQLGYPLVLSNTLTERLPKLSNTIGIAPFAKYESKTFPLKEMKKIVVALAAKGYKVYLFGGGKKETQLLHQWEKLHDNIESKASKMSFYEELSLIAQLPLMLSMDSANMHLASLMGTRVISFWGGTHPFAGFLGYGQSMDDVVQDESLAIRPTSIFGKDPRKYKGYNYFVNLSTDDVIKKILTRI